MNYWLVKSEPYKYSWTQLLSDGRTFWDGVRNFQARNYLKSMKINDKVLFYHSNEGLCIMGVAKVAQEHYPDPTDTEGKWVCVDIEPEFSLNKPVSLAQIKQEPKLSNLPLLKQPRLSVMPITKEEFEHILFMGK
ncbi:MAG: EVE domain-containing protein [Bacteroidia bacterium]|nr:EVE domain-containing protein [Bacteroidia bacterium]MDW8346693.1 EVE domain-containing protein [Bacteroidia bacterium]